MSSTFSTKLDELTLKEIAFDEQQIKTRLLNLHQPCYVVRVDNKIGFTNQNHPSVETIAIAPPIPPEQLGDRNFHTFHGVKYAYAAGAMAGGIASEAMVIALGKAGILGSFGAAGFW